MAAPLRRLLEASAPSPVALSGVGACSSSSPSAVAGATDDQAEATRPRAGGRSATHFPSARSGLLAGVAMRARVLLLVGLAACAGSAEIDADGRATSAITNGTVDEGHPAVGALLTSTGFVCSATLVGARSVLTAAHCVSRFPTTYQFVLAGRAYAVASAQAHPGYDPITQAHDLGVLRLAERPAVEPSWLAAAPPAVGLAIVVVGLGCEARANDCAYGQKRMTRNAIATVSADDFVFASGASGAGGHCDGDSGGPSYATIGGREVLIGVHTWGPASCSGDNHDARVDRELAWIAERTDGEVAIAPAPAPDAAGCAFGDDGVASGLGADGLALVLAIRLARRRS